PATICAGRPGASVTIVGTVSGGSGFFDPGADPGGPGYASHIAASVSGGVTVTGVTFTDPTHVTLALDTTAATSGPVNVTVTNPDGQSSNDVVILSLDPPTTPVEVNDTLPFPDSGGTT